MTAPKVANALGVLPTAAASGSLAAWSVKTSFCRYISGLPDGVCTISEDVRLVGAGYFLLPGRIDEFDSGFVWISPASRRFDGHGGLLPIELRDLQLKIRANQGSLFIAAADGRPDATRLAEASIGDRSDSMPLVDLNLTAEGAAVFGGSYSPNEPLDSIRLMAESLPQRNEVHDLPNPTHENGQAA